MDSRFDDLLHTVIVEKGQGIYGFFDVVFGFMYRRTDLFYEMAPGENMGFFPGQAESIVYNFLRKYQNLHFKERVPKRNIDPKEIEDFMKKQKELKESGKTDNTSKISSISDNSNSSNNSKIEDLKSNVSKNTVETAHVVDKIDINSNSNLNKVTPTTIKPSDKKVDNSISTYNGDQCDKYNWSQGVMDVTIQIKLPEGTNKKMVNYLFTINF
jgi:hypothetical protein